MVQESIPGQTSRQESWLGETHQHTKNKSNDEKDRGERQDYLAESHVGRMLMKKEVLFSGPIDLENWYNEEDFCQ